MTTDAVSRPRAAGQNEDTIVRYTFFERVNHWIGAFSYIYLLATGLAFWSPYLYWLAAVVGGGPIARAWHPWFGLIFTASIMVTFSQWRGDMEIDATDRAWAKAIPDYIKNEDEKLPPVGRFNYGQKLFFWGIFYSIILLLLSGVVLWYTETLPWSLRFLRYAAVLIHASAALITIGLFLIHVYMSAFLEEGSFGSMIVGRVTPAWAWTFHRTWYYKIIGRSQPDLARPNLPRQ
jgi:formate dehydrogenase subunit gamma